MSHLISDLGKSSEELSFESNETDTTETDKPDQKQNLEKSLNAIESLNLNDSDTQLIKALIKEPVPESSKAGNEKIVVLIHINAQKTCALKYFLEVFTLLKSTSIFSFSVKGIAI